MSIDLFIFFTIIYYYIGFPYSDICNLLKSITGSQKWQEKKVDLEEKQGLTAKL